MGRKNKRKHVKIRPIRAAKYINKGNKRRFRNERQSGTINTYGKLCNDSAVQKPAIQKPYKSRIRRGDIWFAQLGDNYGTHVEAGIHPVFVISNNKGNHFSGVCTVVPLTSKQKKMYLPTHVLIPASSCVQVSYTELKDLVLLTEQVATLDKEAFIRKIAYVADKGTLERIEKAVEMHLGLADIEGDSIKEEQDSNPHEGGVADG